MHNTYELTVERNYNVVGFGEHYTEEMLLHNIRRILDRTEPPYKITIDVAALDSSDAV